MPAPYFKNAGPWGSGNGTGLAGRLTSIEGDDNIYFLWSLLLALQDHANINAGIVDITESAGNLFVTLTDSTILGPFAIPTPELVAGPWQPFTSYSATNVTLLSVNNSVYAVTFSHTSAATFDPNATDGLGHTLYQFLFSNQVAPVVTISTSTFTPDITHANTYVRLTHPGGCDVFMPDDASMVCQIGTEISFEDVSESGAVFYSALSPADIVPVRGHLNMSGDVGGVVTLKKIASNTWKIFGLLATGS